jgi:hypothetical protein
MKIRNFHLRIFPNMLRMNRRFSLYDSTVESFLADGRLPMKISEESAASVQSGEIQSPPALPTSSAAKKKLSLPAIVAGRFGKFDIAQRALLLGRLLASVGPLALKVIGGGVFAKYVRHARSSAIPVSFDDAAHATASQVSDLVHYVEQSNPRLVEELSTTPLPNEVRGYLDQTPLETKRPRRRIGSQPTLTQEASRTLHSPTPIESEDPLPRRRFRWRSPHDD